MQKFYRTILTLMLLSCLSIPEVVNGQGVTTASISGRITDSQGEGLPGASVVALHNPSGTEYGTSTRPDGRFNLPNLRIGGPYTITISFVGYQEQKEEGIMLALGQNLSINKVLAEQTTQLAEVIVAGEGDVFNKSRTGAASTFTNDQIRNLPTITRSAADIYRLTPSSDGNSFGGRNDQYNNFSLNGAIFNNPFGLDAATPGGQSDAQPISLDAIDQIQVAVAPYDVTQAGFTGASVNAVTKSGTNKFSGTVFGFYRNQGLTGSKVDGQSIIVPDISQLQTGFSFGGPIKKDKLFFFVNFEMERREDQGSNYLAARPGLSGENVSRVSAQDLDLVSFVLDSAFGYQTGRYEGFTHKTDNQKGIIKLDWNINKNHTLTAIYNFLDAYKDKPAHPNAIGRRGPDVTTLQFYSSGYRINNVIHSGIIELKSIFGNKFSNKLQVGKTVFNDSRDPFSTPFPVVNINQDGIRAIVAGHEPFSIHNLLDQDVFQISDNFDIYAGDHAITVGTSFEKFQFDNSFNLDAYGGTFTPGYGSADEFADLVRSGEFDDDVAAALATFSTRNANDSWALAETNVGQWAFYVQDAWRVNEKLTITAGLRGDLPLYFDTDEKIKENLAVDRNCCYDPTVIYYDENGNPIQFDQTKLPDQKLLFSPRVGFNWNSSNELQLRGGSGLFTGRFPFVWVGNQVANPNFFFYNVTHPDFKFPQVWRSNIGVDKRLNGGWILSADVIYTEDVNAMMVRNYGLKPPSGALQGVDNRPVYVAADRTVPYANNAYVFTNSTKGRSVNVTLEVKKEWSGGWYSSLAYNYLDAKDVSSIEAEISSDAYDRNPALGNVNQSILSPSLYGNKHRIVGTANKTFTYGQDKFATTLSLFFEYAKGGRFSYTYSGDINGDGSGLNDLIYIPTDAEINTMTFSGSDSEQAAQRTALKNFISQDDYLQENRGSYAEKYGILSPWFSRYDLRILQDFVLGNANKIQFSIDILNIGNLISSSWGVRQLPSNTQPIGVTVDAAGNPTYSFDPALKNTFTNDFSLASRWQVQFGLRYIF